MIQRKEDQISNKENQTSQPDRLKSLSRRRFLAVTGALLGSSLATAGCSFFPDKTTFVPSKSGLSQLVSQKFPDFGFWSGAPGEIQTNQAEAGREYEFKIGKIRVDKPFSIIVPGEIAKDSGHPRGVEISINLPLVNRAMAGWPEEITKRYADYGQYPGAALVAQSDILGHEVVVLHSYKYAGKDLPGEIFRNVTNKEGLVGEKFSLRQTDGQTECRVTIVNVKEIPSELFDSSDARPTNTNDPLKSVFFRSDIWGLPEEARRPDQITFATCDNRYWGNNKYQFASTLLLTAQVSS